MLETIFGYYDNLIVHYSPITQAIISLMLFIFLVGQIYSIIKSGHWFFIAALLVFLPSTWPATKHIFFMTIDVLKFLLIRIGLVFT